MTPAGRSDGGRPPGAGATVDEELGAGMADWRRWLRLALLILATLVLYFTLPVSDEIRGSEWVRALVALAALCALVTLVLRQVLLQMEHPDRRVDGLVVALVVGVTAFAYSFYAISIHRPGQLVGIDTRLDSLYFTLTTLLTVGFGDIHAEGQLARGLVVVQMVFNVAVIATAATTLSNQVRTRAQARTEQLQGRRTQRKPR